jgi:TRAP-type C4-dicarboxylate transport system permease small subunit
LEVTKRMNIALVTDKILDGITVLLEYMMGIFMVALVIITFGEVVLRYVFNSPTSWSSELARFILMWMTFTGASIATRYCTHLTMGFNIYRFIGEPYIKVFKIFVNIFIVITMFVITYYSAKVTLIAGGRIAPMTKMPMYYPWAGLPINAFIMSVYLIAETVKTLSGNSRI